MNRRLINDAVSKVNKRKNIGVTTVIIFLNNLGWAIAARERDWKYRLSIYYAKIQDSGIYTCSTPRGLSNSIRVHVVGKFNYVSPFLFFFILFYYEEETFIN